MIQYEKICKEKGKGWYCTRDLEDTGYADYLYKRLQITVSGTIHIKEWVRPECPIHPHIQEFFTTKREAIMAMANLYRKVK